MAIEMLILSSDDIVLITQNVLQTMLGFSAEPIAQQTPGDSQTPSDESALITASIAISGAWDGEVELTNMIAHEHDRWKHQKSSTEALTTILTSSRR